MTTLGGVSGIPLGGVITQALSWRWGFLINVPIAAAVLTFLAHRVATDRPGRRDRPDAAGALALTATLSVLVYALLSTPEHGWTAPFVPAALAGSLALFTAFLTLERRARTPLVPPGLLRHKTRAAASTALGLVAAAMFAAMFLLTLHLQSTLGYGPLRAGLGMAPMTLLSLAGAVTASKLALASEPVRC
ncbi:MFS transporter [Streptomyces sp. NPDC127108]|uniref:MFS transporter n=1 Tax=Streptomyces sp. NPDC127108 TaxID=3345361 RepID=UPI00362E058F